MAEAQVPVIDDRTNFRSSYRPLLDKIPSQPRKWTFSFQYWRQIEYFGLDRTKTKWFASLLEKLQVLSNEEIDKFLRSSRTLDVWRYHSINWGHKNIPVRLHDLDWLPPHVVNNPEEFPLVQFQVSKALGRVVGFWDINDVFSIVLLDSWHNIQPSKDHNYKVDPCNPLSCEYTTLLCHLDEVLENVCERRNCDCVKDIRSIKTGRDELLENNVLMVKLTEEDIELSNYLVEEGQCKSLNQIFKDGLKINFK